MILARHLVALVLAGSPETIDLATLSARALDSSPRIRAISARSTADVESYDLLQTSPFPTLRGGARLWPLGNPSDTTMSDTSRWRLYAQLRYPLVAGLTSLGRSDVEAALQQKGRAEEKLVRELLLKDLGTAYAMAEASQRAIPAYAELFAVLDRQAEVLKTRLVESASTLSDLGRAQQIAQAAIAGQEEMKRNLISARARLEILTRTSLAGVELLPIAPTLAARDEDDAAERAKKQRAEVLIAEAEAAQWRREGGSAWRQLGELEVGVGYARGTTGTLDELSGLSALVELAMPIDGPWRFAEARRRDRDYAEAFEAEAAQNAEIAAAEARTAFDLYHHWKDAAEVASRTLDAAREERARLASHHDVVQRAAMPIDMPAILGALVLEHQARVQMIEARGQADLAYVALVAAQGDDLSQSQAGPNDKSSPPASRVLARPSPPRERARGMWIWRTKQILESDAAVDALVGFVEREHLTEVYISMPQGTTRSARLPALLVRLHKAGVRAEALIGEATWYRPEGRAQMLSRIEEIASVSASARFDGIHLDIEPHQLRENKGTDPHRYLAQLIDTFRAARAAADGAHLSLAVDLPRKMLRISREEGQTLMSAASRIVFMAYEVNAKSIGELIRPALGWAQGDGAGEVLVGVRPKDQPDGTSAALEQIEQSLAKAPSYGGWAVHDYVAYRSEKGG
jgi:hypothetical protein